MYRGTGLSSVASGYPCAVIDRCPLLGTLGLPCSIAAALVERYAMHLSPFLAAGLPR